MAKKEVETKLETDEVVEDAEITEDETVGESKSAMEIVDAADVIKEDAPAVKETSITEEDANQFFKDTIYADAFMRRTVNVPGKKKMKTVFKDEEEIFGNVNGLIDTYGSLKKKEYAMLSDSAKSEKPKVLYGRIDGVEEIQREGQRMCEAVCHLITDDFSKIGTPEEMTSGIYKIKIPAQMLFFYDQKRFDTPTGYETLKRNLDMRVKSVVEFVVYDINAAEDEVLASSITAKQILQYDNYLKKNRRGSVNIKPGTIAFGHITNVNSRGVTVNVFGAEVFVKNSELGWRYINNALEEKKYFYVGKPVAVRITSVDKTTTEIFGQKYPYIEVEGSVRAAMENPNKLFYEDFKRGQKYTGQIAYRLTTGEYIVNLGSEGSGLNGDRVVCMCKAPSLELGGTPYIGQTCSVVITSKNDDKYLLFGAFAYMEG